MACLSSGPPVSASATVQSVPADHTRDRSPERLPYISGPLISKSEAFSRRKALGLIGIPRCRNHHERLLCLACLELEGHESLRLDLTQYKASLCLTRKPPSWLKYSSNKRGRMLTLRFFTPRSPPSSLTLGHKEPTRGLMLKGPISADLKVVKTYAILNGCLFIHFGSS